MKKSSILLFAFTIGIGLMSCKSKKETQKAEQTASVPAVCSVLVEFYSIGAGIDYKNAEKLTAYLTEKKLKFETQKWGREGEINYCIRLDDKKAKEKAAIIAEVKKMLESSQNTRIQEDKPLKK